MRPLTSLPLFMSCALAATWAHTNENYSPFVDRQGMEQVYWGDTHLHTSYSTDAGMIGTTVGPETAYRFARGDEVVSSTGLKARISRPLDFLVVSDHAENLGLAPSIERSDPRLLANPWGREIHDLVKSGERYEAFLKWGGEAMLPQKDPLAGTGLAENIWQSQVSTAEEYNQPGTFTALIGYEWTSTPEGNNLHRVVIFRDDAGRAGQVLPYSQYDSIDPEDLWSWMASYEQKTGGSVLAIPHNGNLSNGLMFPVTERHGDGAVDSDYAKRRARWEPVVEVTQIKGDGEAHPLLSPDDEFADYETWDAGNFEGAPKTNAMLQFEYARSALKNGLSLQARLGANPYAFGMIGSTDAHTALAAVEENNFFGKHSGVEPGENRWTHLVGRAGVQAVKGWQQASSGYAAVWARENTREALWDAIKRREVYATTGPRISVRFFGGRDFHDSDANAPDIARIGYARGVPMGGVLAPGKGAPSFLMMAAKDPLGANLDRAQMVKGWLDDKGDQHEKIYNISWSGERQLDDQGKLADVGSSVDVAQASWQNTLGSPQLATVWRDPDFDPAERAFYYLRVIEIPTPRWTAYDARRYQVTMAEEVPMSTRERAYTSPIWYVPGAPGEQ